MSESLLKGSGLSQRCAVWERINEFTFALLPASFCADDTNGDIRNDIGQRPNWCEQAENHNHEHGECEATAKTQRYWLWHKPAL